MQFFTIATLLFTAASGVMGAPAPAAVSAAQPSRLQARTCGTLTGKPLEVCQGVCKAACNAIPPSLAKTACKKSCTLGPLKAREVEETEENDEDAFAHIDFDVFASLGGDDDDDVNAKATADASAPALQAREPGISKHDVCHAACAVTCNSTVLALRQKWCLEKCNAKCPAE